MNIYIVRKHESKKWDIVPKEIKNGESLNSFTEIIKMLKPLDSPRRLCKLSICDNAFTGAQESLENMYTKDDTNPKAEYGVIMVSLWGYFDVSIFFLQNLDYSPNFKLLFCLILELQ